MMILITFKLRIKISHHTMNKNFVIAGPHGHMLIVLATHEAEAGKSKV